jgi:serine protease Do
MANGRYFFRHGSTCEGRDRGDPPSRISIPTDDPFVPFTVSDPWGFRRAIVPIFRQDTEGVAGVGTAFQINRQGTFLTAHHNLGRQSYTSKDIGETAINDPYAPRIMLLLPYGLVFGTTKLPGNAMITISKVSSPLVQAEDPIEYLKGHDVMNALDIATLRASIPPNLAVDTLPLCVSKLPALGEPVLALGYPTLTAENRLSDSAIVTVSEEMQGAFGRVTGFFPWGRGSSNPTPVYEVEANWHSGMSGGPVLNSAGDVIGVVSRSILSDDIAIRNGRGYVSALGLMSNIVGSLPIDGHFKAVGTAPEGDMVSQEDFRRR